MRRRSGWRARLGCTLKRNLSWMEPPPRSIRWRERTFVLHQPLTVKEENEGMALQVVGAGLPRTGTSSLKVALEHLLGGRCYHMAVIPGRPFVLGEGWDRALAGAAGWETLLAGYAATVDWPASLFWRELSAVNPGALVLLSVRDSAELWWR